MGTGYFEAMIEAGCRRQTKQRVLSLSIAAQD
jgi:hypothetical protein